MKNSSLLLLAGILSLGACKKDLERKFEETQQAGTNITVNKMSEIKVPANFKWELTKSVSVKVNLEDNSFGALKHKVQIYLEDPANKGISLAEGALSLAQEFESTVAVPSATKELYVVRTAPDNSKMIEKVTISGSNSVLLNIKPNLKKTFSLGKSASPDCNTGCTQTITTNNTNLNVNSGAVICVTGNNITIGFNANGGTIRICGSNVRVQNANLNNSSTLIVTSGASVEFDNFNMNGATTVFQNWGTVTIDNSFSPGGSVTNHGTITTDGDYNLNTQSTQTNNGTINVGESMNVNGNTTLTNNGSIVTDQDFKVNGTGLFINNCKLWTKEKLHNNNNIKNYSYIRVDDETVINGGAELGMYNGAMFKTTDMTLNGIIKGYVANSLVKVLDKTRINGGGSVVNFIQYCDVNGIETNNGTIGSGATQACGLYIATTACNPEGNGTAPNPNPDTDGDGVIDASDCYPSDPNKAFCNNVPTGTLAFEDQWPFTGDYDMNDVVVTYNYNVITNASNNVVRVE
ncbi:MAG: LruC domain-containing protein, partial [Bacteroidia bacterium]